MANFAAMGKGGFIGIGFAVITIVPMIIGILVKSFSGVKSGEMGIRVFFDVPRKNRDGSWKYLSPGPHFVVPGFHSIKTINVQERTEVLEPFMVDVIGANNLIEQREVKVKLKYKVNDSTEGNALKNAIYKAQDLGAAVRAQAGSGLLSIFDGRDAANLKNEANALRQLRWLQGKTLAETAVNLLAVYLSSRSASHSQMLKDGMRESGANTEKLAAFIDSQDSH
jgi:hypothetical protein